MIEGRKLYLQRRIPVELSQHKSKTKIQKRIPPKLFEVFGVFWGWWWWWRGRKR